MQRLGCDSRFIARWSRRFLAERLAGLYARHPGRVIENQPFVMRGNEAPRARAAHARLPPAFALSRYWQADRALAIDPDRSCGYAPGWQQIRACPTSSSPGALHSGVSRAIRSQTDGVQAA
ncbi:hypothetical protein P3W85_34595 [Cupriavidus basilensis]|uniref:Mobile element protein n=1 Tax=Cupriavidus basilensis TaxID=68895 RepID=A0ABT6AZJ1_9BURK|nr:hypothetical protein [Cupriavidus basilensis]MDF3838025.1 hypothetical protein [Cupriavidus basilensis]